MEQTIAAISTATATGGIGIIRISGAEASRVADRVFRGIGGKTIENLGGYQALYGHIVGSDGVVDEAVALKFSAPRSYTGEDVVELSCHGGIAVMKETLSLVLKAGARLASPGEFTRRAFTNGKMTLTQAEAVMDIISAKGKEAARAAVAAREGALAKKLQKTEEELTNVAAWLGAWADFPEEEIPEVDGAALLSRLTPAMNLLTRLIEEFESGRILREGIETVIAGCPNVGKSTLMNYLCGYQSSIVTPIAGTTRDVVSQEILLGDYRLHLSDTAGIRATTDTVEQFGVERAKDCLNTASLIFAVFDSSRPLNAEDWELIRLCEGRKAIAIINKSDLESKTDWQEIQKHFAYTVFLSAKQEEGRDQLADAITHLFSLGDFDGTQGFLCNTRQLDCATRAKAALQECMDAIQMNLTLDAVSVSLDGCLEALFELSGKKVTEEVADGVFHQFCVGK